MPFSTWMRPAVIGVAAATAVVPASWAAQPGPSPPAVSLAPIDAESRSQEPLPSTLSLEQSLLEAQSRAPSVIAARLGVSAAEARLRQAGFGINPELTVEFENFLGTGEFAGARSLETTVAVNQRLDLGGRRRARVSGAQAQFAVAQLRLAIARADVAREVRQFFARAITARDRLQLAEDNDQRARELARIAGQLVAVGRDPPLRAIRARSAAAQAAAELEAARADYQVARLAFAGLFGIATPPEALTGPLLDLQPNLLDPEQSLEVRLAEVELVAAEAALSQERVGSRLDPSVGLGVRHNADSGAVGLVGALSMPLPIFDRNSGNISAARAEVEAAQVRVAASLAAVRVRAQNAIAQVEAAQARVRALDGAAVPEAFEALRLAQISYREGRASLVELLDTQNAYTAAQSALLDARLALALATAELGRVAAQ
jgi:outer membrane protein, heavy metal efflux system